MPIPVQGSPWQRFCEKWVRGCGSSQCETANSVVLARGSVPCDILFIGEAPGESEDVLGKPFCGPAGKLMEQIVANALRFYPPDRPLPRLAYTNLVCCIPREEGERGGIGKAAEPHHEQVIDCQERLGQFIDLCRPRLIITVGALAKRYVDAPGNLWKGRLKLARPVPVVDVTHPAAILRADMVHKALMIQKCEVIVQNAIEEYLL